MSNQTKTPKRAPLVIAPTTQPNPLLMQRLAAIDERVEYGQIPEDILSTIGVPAQTTRGAA